ncbi:MAG TPA: alpha/beta hydrolase fold domain-containing protein [Acidimicrobiales bacterium]|jgi:acetyl esterase/lipase
MPSQSLIDILALIPPDFADPEADYIQVRATMAPFHGHPVGPAFEVELATLGGVRVATVSAAGPRTGDQIVAFHCHGGGLVSCPLDSYLFFGALLAEHLGVTAVLPDYRLAPEHPYPAAQDDCLAAYRGLLESGIDPTRVVVTGDSCGAGLALSALLTARDQGIPMPAGFVSLSGWFDLAVADPNESGTDPFLTTAWVRNRGRDYTQGMLPLGHPSVSSAHAAPAALAGLPPLYLAVGQYDTLRHGVDRLAANALAAEVAVQWESWPGMVHGWQGLALAGVPEALAALGEVRNFIDRSTGTAAAS